MSRSDGDSSIPARQSARSSRSPVPPGPAGEPEAGKPSAARREGPQVLFLGEDRSFRYVCRTVLREAGCRFAWNADSRHGLDRLSRERFDLVICDSDAVGANFLNQLDGLESFPPIILLSVYEPEETRNRRVRRRGIVQLSKPVELDALLKTARSMIPEERWGKQARPTHGNGHRACGSPGGA